ncbi:MAG TPA: glycoside hydrolase family 43 protein [Bacilli bacterium]
MKLEDIKMRDPFIFPDKKRQRYFLYGSERDRSKQDLFKVYTSSDLDEWDEGKVIFFKNPGFWGKTHFWAPELHFIEGKYYLFATFFGDNGYNRSQILVCDTPDGTFVPYYEPITPFGQAALDATYFESDGKRYSVYCHEWKDVGDGEICLVELDDKLRPVTEPAILFRASDAPWVVNASDTQKCLVTDGPFLIQEGTTLFMLWSSFSKAGYAVAYATAENIFGPWKQQFKPLLNIDGGHAMIFEDLSGVKHLICHAPNSFTEHPVLFTVEINDKEIKII